MSQRARRGNAAVIWEPLRCYSYPARPVSTFEGLTYSEGVGKLRSNTSLLKGLRTDWECVSKTIKGTNMKDCTFTCRWRSTAVSRDHSWIQRWWHLSSSFSPFLISLAVSDLSFGWIQSFLFLFSHLSFSLTSLLAHRGSILTSLEYRNSFAKPLTTGIPLNFKSVLPSRYLL